jgi:hypothetical protein
MNALHGSSGCIELWHAEHQFYGNRMEGDPIGDTFFLGVMKSAKNTPMTHYNVLVNAHVINAARYFTFGVPQSFTFASNSSISISEFAFNNITMRDRRTF